MKIENERLIGDIPISKDSSKFIGKNYLLVIGIDKYADAQFVNLNNAVSDAKCVTNILIQKYGFENEAEFLLFNDEATQHNIIEVLKKLIRLFNLEPDQNNLLVYFSGHGHYDNESKIGFRIASDSTYRREASYIEDSSILDRIKSIKAKHILLVSDSCFSGAMVRSVEVRNFQFEEISERLPSRHIITSGLLQTVSDGACNDSSPFAKAFISYLDANCKPLLPFSDVAQHIKHTVPQNTKGQKPHYGTLFESGSYNGEFVLRIKNIELIEWDLLNKDDLVALSKYVYDYPNSIKLNDANELIQKIKTRDKKQKIEIEKQAYEYAKSNPTIASMNRFLREYPLSQYEKEVEILLENLEENAAWKDAKNKNTITGFREFIRRFENSKLVDEAKKRIFKIEEKNEPKIEYFNKKHSIDMKANEVNKIKFIPKEHESPLMVEKILSVSPPNILKKLGLINIIVVACVLILSVLIFRSFSNTVFSITSNKLGDSLTYVEFKVPEMVYIKGEPFLMGSNIETNEKPIHEVNLNDFSISKYEVTLTQFAKFIEESKYITSAEKKDSAKIFDGVAKLAQGVNWRFDEKGRLRIFPKEYDHPVVYVSWNDANEFCKWLSKKTQRKYFLPTEAQWEFVAGNGIKHTKYSFGDDEPKGKSICNFADKTFQDEFKKDPNEDYIYLDGQIYSWSVGNFKSNDLGVYDMSGNVLEWCSDWYKQDYYSDGDSFANPLGPKEGKKRVVKGGSWADKLSNCRVANRTHFAPDNYSCYLGFRVVCQN